MRLISIVFKHYVLRWCTLFYLIVESGQRFDKNVSSLIAKFVSTRGEKVERLIQIEIEVAIKMSPHKLVDFLLKLRVQVLELVQIADHVKTVGSDDIGFTFDQVFGFLAGDFRHGGEGVR